MTRPETHPTSAERDAILAQFSRNLPRHISGVAAIFNQRLTRACRDAGHPGIRAPFVQMLFQLGPDGGRIVDIAHCCGITQQAGGQIAAELERRGYLRRKPDARDGRAKKLVLSAKGEKLLGSAEAAAQRIDAELAEVLGAELHAGFKESCIELFRGLIAPDVGAERLSGAAALPLCMASLSMYTERRLMEMDEAKGYDDLKMSFSQVLLYTSPHGTLINDLARLNGVSKQAISQTVKQVEQLGYVERRQHPGDGRSSMIFLTDAGLALIKTSIDSFGALEDEFSAVLQKRRARRFAQTVERLADHLGGSAPWIAGEHPELSAEALLQRLVQRLYRESAEPARSRLFNRAGDKAMLSGVALRILDALEVRVMD